MIETAPGRNAALLPELRQGDQVVSIGRDRMAAHAPLVGQVQKKPCDPDSLGVIYWGRVFHVGKSQRALYRINAYVTSSPTRDRNSVLMPGWNLSASLAPMARIPNSPLG